jgi:hypothetical protein
MFADAGKAAIKASEAMKLTFASVDMCSMVPWVGSTTELNAKRVRADARVTICSPGCLRQRQID